MIKQKYRSNTTYIFLAFFTPLIMNDKFPTHFNFNTGGKENERNDYRYA
jgi:hypothetical protein